MKWSQEFANTAASAGLESASSEGLPLSFGEKRSFSDGKLFSNKNEKSSEISLNLDQSLTGGVTAGVHHKRIW